MTVFMAILGVLVMIFGFSCMFTPLGTFLSLGVLIGIVLLIYGVSGMVRMFTGQSGIVEGIFSAISLVLGVVSFFRPGTTLIFDSIMIYAFSIWFILMGIVTIYAALGVRKLGQGGWVFNLIVGILAIILGIYSLVHPMVAALATGILVGLYIVEIGCDMLTLALFANRVQKDLESVQNMGN